MFRCGPTKVSGPIKAASEDVREDPKSSRVHRIVDPRRS